MIEASPHIEKTVDLFEWACPTCVGPLDLRETGHVCRACQATYERRDGILQFLPPERAAVYAAFLNQYQNIRRREKWGRAAGEYYRTLPKVGPKDPNRSIWRVRCRTFRTFVRRTLTPLESSAGRPLRVIDLGAGNGWLSYRLASRGHHLAAVDLNTDELDGLGAHTRYDSHFTPVRAEFDRLPFADGQFDLAIFDASIHYSKEYTATLHEAFRILRVTGALVILDTPVYRNTEDGRRMVRERESEHSSRFGITTNGIHTEGFLTCARLNELARLTGASWKMIRPYNGPRWMLRRLAALILRRRRPARFPVISANKPRHVDKRRTSRNGTHAAPVNRPGAA